MSQLNKDNFYEELDSRRYKHTTNCTALITFFIIFTILGSLFVVWGIGKLRSRVSPHFNKDISSINVQNLSLSVQDYLSKSKTDDTKITVVLDDQDLTAILKEASQEDDNFNLTNPKATITADKIILEGRLEKPIAGRIAIEMVPHVNDGELSLEVTDVKLANLTLPGFLQSRVVGPILNKSVLKTLNDSSVYYDSVKLSDQKMTLAGHKQ